MSSLTELKAHLLPASARVSTSFDDAILAIGLGVANLFETLCDRKFARAEEVEEFAGPRAHLYLRRTPVEAVTRVEVRAGNETEWTEQANAVRQLMSGPGLVLFNGLVTASSADLVRVTYTGGYWWDESEDGSGEMPATATALPAGLRLAWLTQCAEVWNKRDKLGSGLVGKPDQATNLSGLDLAPLARELIKGYVRLAAL